MVRVGSPHRTSARGNPCRWRAETAARSIESGWSPSRFRSSDRTWASSKRSATPTRPAPSAAATVCARDSASAAVRVAGSPPSDHSNPSYVTVAARRAPSTRLPTAARTFFALESLERSRSRWPSSSPVTRSSLLCLGSNSIRVVAQPESTATSSKRLRRTVLPTPRSPVRRRFAGISGADARIDRKRRIWTSRPARCVGSRPTPGR